MTNDPLILEAVRLIKQSEDELVEAMRTSSLQSMYEVGRIQGRLQGLRHALQAIDEAAKQLYEEE